MYSLIIDKVKKEYGFKNPILLKRFDTRGNRSAFLIANGKNKYVLKSLPNKKELKNKLKILSKIKEQGINVPHIVNTKLNKSYFLYLHSAFFLSKFINLKENRPSKIFFENLGSAVGKFHRIKKLNKKVLHSNIFKKIKTTKETLFKSKINKKMRKEIIYFSNYFPGISGLTEGPIHGDISYFNALGKKKIYFIDFDDLSFGPIVYDIGQMIAFMFNLIPYDFPKFGMKKKNISEPIFLMNGFEIFLKNYSREIKLSEEDIEILPKMAMLACLENVYLKSTNSIFQWNYKRFKKIKKNEKLIKEIAKKYFL